MACETSPIRMNEEVMKRYSRAPPVKIETKVATATETESQKQISKLEQNLKRFEEERRRFAQEREKFEQEKRHMEHLRFQRLLEFERRRTMQHRDREQLAVEAAAIALVEIEKQRIVARHRRSKSKSREQSRTRSMERYEDDYESSTATTISSRAGDFDDEIDVFDGSHTTTNGHAIVSNGGSNLESVQPDEDPGIETATNVELKQSWLSRMLFGKRKSIPVIVIEKKSYRHMIVDDGGPISIKRILTIEAPLVWQQLIEDHPDEWFKLIRLRNRCIANFIILSIFFGFGGLVFRFIEGAFENFYKCGVRRVKRDFVDHLWVSSHDMRFKMQKFMNFSQKTILIDFQMSQTVKTIGKTWHEVS